MVTEATTVPPRVLRESSDIFMPPGRVLRTTRDSMLDGLGSKASPAATTAEPLKSLNVAAMSGVAGISARSGALGGDEAGQRAVGFLQVGFGDAQHVGLGDCLDAVAHQEHQPPIALRGVLAEIERDRLGIVHLQFDILQQAGLGALHLFLAGRFGGEALRRS